jgi:hypothetical protein
VASALPQVAAGVPAAAGVSVDLASGAAVCAGIAPSDGALARGDPAVGAPSTTAVVGEALGPDGPWFGVQAPATTAMTATNASA